MQKLPAKQLFCTCGLKKKPRFQRQKPGFVCHSTLSLIPIASLDTDGAMFVVVLFCL